MGNAHNHGGGCSSCHQNDCSCDNILDREDIHDHHQFAVLVNGDYEADPDDAVIRVKAGTIVNGVPFVPTITLADPGEHGVGHITIVAQGGDVRVVGLNDQNAVNFDGAPSNGARLIAGGSAVTFWRTEGVGGHNDCNCTTSDYWIVENGVVTAAAPAA